MEDTGKILLFVSMIVATARSVHGIYHKDATRELQSYIVHMDPTKVQIPDSMKPATWYASLIHDALVKAGALNENELTESNILYAYDTVLTGFAAKLNHKQVAVIKAMEGCMGAYPDDILKLHTTYTPQFLGLKRGHGLWSKSTGYAADVIIGVLDTGVWPEHPSFADHKTQTPVPSKWKGDCEAGRAFNASLCNKKLIGARFFSKTYESIFGPINETAEYRSPRDSNGHGTHTASTAAGNVVPCANILGYAKGLASGMAPGARVAVYKVCWLPGCFSSDVLAGMDKAVADGVDVMSISIGGGTSSTPFYLVNQAIGAFGAVARGVFVSSSAGNSGPYPSSTFNGAPWIMTVGASSVDRRFPSSVVLGNGKAYRGASVYSGKPLGRKPNLALVYGETACMQGSCCSGSLEPKLVQGKIVVCEGDSILKGQVVARAGGIGMINLNAENMGEEFIAQAHILPAALVGVNAGKEIRAYLKSRNPSGTIVFHGTAYHNEEAPALTFFSSRGPHDASPGIVKPDIIAPGLNILAACPQNLSPSRLRSDKRRTNFILDSGTSMSCPHVSGLAALLKAVHPDWSPAAIKSALMTTAYVTDNQGRPIKDASFLGPHTTPFDIGAGHVNPEKAQEPGLVYDISTEDYVNYLCSLNYSSSQILMVTQKLVSCQTKVSKPEDLNYPSFWVALYSSANSSATFTRKVTNVGPHLSIYSVQVAEPKGVKVSVNPRRLVFTKKNQRHVYTVSFRAEKVSASGTYGSITWSSGLHAVRSPVAVTWDY